MLNESQQAVVDCNDPHILCLAGAGTGKTHCMLARIYRLIDTEPRVSPTRMLVLTFTNAAALEMKSRYTREHNSGGVTPQFCTFHSFCYQLILNDIEIRQHIGYSECPSIITEEALSSLSRLIRQQFSITTSSAALARDNSHLSREDIRQKDIYTKMLRRKLLTNNYITFDIMSDEICKLFSQNDPLIHKYKDQYTNIFVDEFQDTDTQQWDFVRSFSNSNIFVVGDVKQNLYSFRGTTNDIIKSLALDDKWTTFKLSHNYRSTRQICEYSNKIEWEHDARYNIALESNLEGDSIKETHIESTDEIITHITNMLQRSGTCAVLARTNREVNDIRNALTARHIPYTSRQNSNDEVANILNSALDNKIAKDYILYRLPTEAQDEYLRISAISNTEDNIDKLLQYVAARSDCHFNAAGWYDTVIQIQKQLVSSEYNYDFERYAAICKTLNIPTILADSSEGTPENIVNRIITNLQPTSSDARLYVGTIHSVKGLEYDNVLLIGVGSKQFRITDEDNTNLFYVGATRAKSYLIVDKSL